MRTYCQFPEILVPRWLESWNDESWANDATACSTLLETETGGFRVWVFHDDVEKREPGFNSRFNVEWVEDFGEMRSEPVLYEGDDEAAAQEAIRAHRELRGAK